jgi:hypothetical protein
MAGDNTSGPYNPLGGIGTTVLLYGASPDPGGWPGPREYPTPFVPHVPGAEEIAEAVRKLMPQVDPPPASAADSEVNAVNVLAKLTPEERARVLRFAVSKWGPVTP